MGSKFDALSFDTPYDLLKSYRMWLDNRHDGAYFFTI